MKIQIDPDNKTIKVEGDVNLGDFIDHLNQFFPIDLWREYSLETNSKIVWENPVIINPYYPQYPYWEYPIITCDTSSMINFEIKY